MRRIGVFGGTFDPPHLGHLAAAREAADRLGLDEVLFVPAGEQPFKVGQEVTPAVHRAAMVERLVAADPRFRLSRSEVDRPGLSYTVDTLRALRAGWPAGAVELVLLLGADAAAQFAAWKDPEAIGQLARVVVLTRGAEPVAPGLEGLSTPRVDVSSTEIRERVRAGQSVRGFVPDAVAEYIAANGLYTRGARTEC